MATSPGQHCPTVQLRHTLPDGSAHIDWMIGVDPEGEQPLVTFRLERRIEECDIGSSIEAERLFDHRPHYLRYEGEISGNRGFVERIAEGEVQWIEQRDDALRVRVRWHDDETPHICLIHRVVDERWTIRALAEDPMIWHNGGADSAGTSEAPASRPM